MAKTAAAPVPASADPADPSVIESLRARLDAAEKNLADVRAAAVESVSQVAAGMNTLREDFAKLAYSMGKLTGAILNQAKPRTPTTYTPDGRKIG